LSVIYYWYRFWPYISDQRYGFKSYICGHF